MNRNPEDDKQQYLDFLANKLYFDLSQPSEVARLAKFVADKNGLLYGEATFKFLPSEFDKDVVVAAVPKLGPKQLGLFALRNYKKGETVTQYDGQNIWGEKSAKEMAALIENCEASGDYFWEYATGSRTSIAIDSRLMGTSARFVNDAVHPNCAVVIKDKKLFYVAKEGIEFGDEITAKYGKEFFSAQNPRRHYTPESLQTILGKTLLYSSSNTTKELPIPLHEIKSRETLKIFLEVIDLSTTDISKPKFKSPKKLPVKLPPIVEITATANTKAVEQPTPSMDKNNQPPSVSTSSTTLTTTLPPTANNQNPALKTENLKLWLDEKFDPLIFDTSTLKQDSFEKTMNLIFTSTSRHKFIIAPTGRFEEHLKFSLFAKHEIAKGDLICEITGVHFTASEIKGTTLKIDEKYLFQIGNSYIYSKYVGSEAFFIHGAKHESWMNAKMTIRHGKAYYVATKPINAGAEIMTYFGKGYNLATEPSMLVDIIANFNQQQFIFDAFLNFLPGALQLDIKTKPLASQLSKFSEIAGPPLTSLLALKSSQPANHLPSVFSVPAGMTFLTSLNNTPAAAQKSYQPLSTNETLNDDVISLFDTEQSGQTNKRQKTQ